MGRNDIFMPEDTDSDTRHRLQTYIDYLDEYRGGWERPNLDVYRGYLETRKRYAPNTVMAHLQTVIGRYRELAEIAETAIQLDPGADGDLMLIPITSELISLSTTPEHLSEATEYTIENMDRPDQLQFSYPSYRYIEQLFYRDLDRPQDLRDLIIVALSFCAGLSDTEIVFLKYKDLDLENSTFIVPAVYADRPRRVRLYDNVLFDEPWLIDAFQVWSDILLAGYASKDISTEITKGSLFYGFYRGGNRLRDQSFSLNGCKKALHRWQGYSENSLTTRDLRGTFARWGYRLGMPLEKIRDNIGLSRMSSTLAYIGPPDREVDYEKVKPLKSAPILRQIESLKDKIRQEISPSSSDG